MSTQSLPLDPIVSARLTDIIAEVDRVACCIDVTADLLCEGDAGESMNARLGLALRVAYDQLAHASDRLDQLNLCDPSRRLVVVSEDPREIPAAA
jgi:hypothetical protein